MGDLFLFLFFRFFGNLSPRGIHAFLIVENSEQYYKNDRLPFSLSSDCAQVIHNKNITKTQKVRFFTGQLLNHIASLYNWNGITDVSPENPESAEVSCQVSLSPGV